MTESPAAAGLGLSPLSSWRADRGARGPTRCDDIAITIAALLRRAAMDSGSRQARRSYREACRMSRQLLSAAQVKEGPGVDEPAPTNDLRLLRTAADHTMRAIGAVALADNMLESLARLVPADTMDGGRILSQRAATSWYMGYNELSTAQYRQLLLLGRRIGERDLCARAMHGLSHVRMSAGNLPAAARLTRSTIRLAGDTFPRVASLAFTQLGIIHAMRGDIDRALSHAWRAFSLAHHYAQGQQAALTNIAQMLLDAGFPAAARAASKHALRKPQPHAHLFAQLGTYAVASASLGDGAASSWAASQVLELSKPPTFAHYSADALLQCSIALEMTGRPGRARRLRVRAEQIAVRHGYHEIAYFAGQGVSRPSMTAANRITAATEAIVSEITQLDSDLPLAEVHAG